MSLTKNDLSQIKEVVEEVSSKQTEDLAVIVAKEINRLDNKIDGVEKRLETKMDIGFKSLEGKLDIHRSLLKDHETRIGTLEQKIA